MAIESKPPPSPEGAHPEPDPRDGSTPRRLPWIWIFLITLALAWWASTSGGASAGRTIPYSSFKTFVARGEVLDVLLSAETISGRIQFKDDIAEPPRPEWPSPDGATASGESNPQRFTTVRVEDPELIDTL